MRKRLLIAGIFLLGLSCPELLAAVASPTHPANHFSFSFRKLFCPRAVLRAAIERRHLRSVSGAPTPYSFAHALSLRRASKFEQVFLRVVPDQDYNHQIVYDAASSIEWDLDSKDFDRGRGPVGTTALKNALVTPFIEIAVRNIESFQKTTYRSDRPIEPGDIDFPGSFDVFEYVFTHVDHTLSRIICFREGPRLAYLAKVSNGANRIPAIYSSGHEGALSSEFIEQYVGRGVQDSRLKQVGESEVTLSRE